MDSSEITAIIALIVSLIALLIALLQLLQSSALSAEGWRRCNQTVIGKWSVFSRRKWLWSELRFEVMFTAPNIQIFNTEDIESGSSRFVTPGFERSGSRSTKYGYKPVFEPGVSFRRPETRLARQAAHLLGFDSLPNSIERAWVLSREDDSSLSTDVSSASFRSNRETGIVSFLLSCLRWRRGYHFRWQQISNPDQKIAITWDTLLNALHQQQVNIIQSRAALDSLRYTPLVSHQRSPQDKITTRNPDPDPPPRELKLLDMLGRRETLVCVELERQSWDFLPTDVTRPLAVSTLKTVVILARRLGMSWRVFDRVANRYHAETKDCNLSATSIQGLGLVFRFESRPQHESEERVIWSVDADKAYFGIVAGDSNLDIDDYPLVGGDRVVHADTVIREQLGDLPYKLRKTGTHLRRVLTNDFVALVSPFIPVRGCQQYSIFSPLPSGNHSKTLRSLSLFKAMASDEAFRLRLSKKIAPYMSRAARNTSLFDLFPRVENSFAQDIDRRYSTRRDRTKRPMSSKPAPDKHMTLKDRCEWSGKIERLREIHKSTTLFFGGDFEATAGDNIDFDVFGMRTDHLPATSSLTVHKGMFRDIMRAHMHLFSTCYFDKYHKSEQKEWKHEMSWNADEKELQGGMSVFENLTQRMEDSLVVFRDYLRDQSDVYSVSLYNDDELDAFWWMMVARGVAWQMSVKVLHPLPSGVVPSDIYYGDMTVWIE